MKSDLRILFEDALSKDKDTRFALAWEGILGLSDFLASRGMTVMARMTYVDLFCFCPLFCDGPINEKELEFLNAVLHQKLSMKEAHNRSNQLDDEEFMGHMFFIMSTLANLHEEELRFALLQTAFIGMLCDSEDEINEKEEKYFDKLLLRQ